MPLQVYYRDTDGTLVGPVTALGLDRIRRFVYETTENAEEGSVGTSRIAVDDPDGNLIIPGLRLIGVRESAASNMTQPFVFAGYTSDRNVLRGQPSHRTTVSRLWDVGVVDANTILEARVMVGADCNRPAETDVQRITWLLSTAESILIQDERYFSSANPEPMDAVDYRGQSFKSIIDDCAQQSGKNYFITYFADTATGNLPWGVFSLWYGHANSSDYSSTISLSNDLSEVDGSSVFAISQENTTLNRDPSRIYSGMYVPYDGGAAYVQRAATISDFMVRDGTSPAQNVKTATKANRRGNRMLTDVSTEEDVVHTEFIVPAAQVNDLRPGMRIPFRATHLPGYETSQWMRCLNRTISQTQEQRYTLKVDLSPTGASAGPPPGVVQFKYGSGTGVTFDDPVTIGHTIVACVINRDAGTIPPDHVIDGISNPAVSFITIAEVVKAFSPSHFARWAGMYYRVVTSVDAGLQTYTSAGSSQNIGLFEIDATYAGIFTAQDTTDIGANTDCGGPITPPNGPSLLIGLAAIGHSDNPGTKPGPVDSLPGITEYVDEWGGGSPWKYIAAYPITDASGEYTVGGALTGSMLDYSWVFCGVTAVFI